MKASAGDLVVATREGLYCPAGDFHIDPWRAVPRAVITHAHADHARRGHGAYLAAADGAGVLRARLGALNLQALAYGEPVTVGGVRVSLHPAGHVLGSAQVRLEHRGRVWVVSGDYHASAHDGDHNPTCAPLEPQRCEVFITESTFALPVYRWRPQREVMAEVNAWWQANAAVGRVSLLLGYSLGKAQRLLAGLEPGTGPIVVHDAVETINAAYRAAGVALPPTLPLAQLGEGLAPAQAARALVIAPPATAGKGWPAALGRPAVAFASGWMQLRGTRRRRGLGRGFVLSDHADWPGLLRTIAATGASRVIVTHGHEAALVRWLREQGLQAGSLATGWGEGEDRAEDDADNDAGDGALPVQSLAG